MSYFTLNAYRVPSKYFLADTIDTESSYTSVHVPPINDNGPTLKPAAVSLTVYANLTLGNVLRQSRDNPSARIDFKKLPSFQTDAGSAAKKISKEGLDDPEVLIDFGRMLKVPMKYGPDVWAFIMQKIGEKLERMGVWKHKAGQSIKKSLELAVQICRSDGHFGSNSDEVESFEDGSTEEYGGARKRSSKSPRQQTPPGQSPRQQTPPGPRHRGSSRSDDGLSESEEDDPLPLPASRRRSSKSPRQQTPPGPRRRGSSRSVTPPDGADWSSGDEGYGSDGSNHGDGDGVRRSIGEMAKLRAEILRKVASKKDLETAMAKGDVEVEALLADKTDEVRQVVRRSVDKISHQVKKLQADVTDHGRRIETQEEGLLNLIGETESDEYIAFVARRLQALNNKKNSNKRT